MNKTNERIKIGSVVDENGVIVGVIREGDKIISPDQNEYKQKHILNFRKKEAFVKVYTNPITILFKELSTKEFAVAMALMPFISYKDGILRHKGKIATIKTISDELCENYDSFKKIISSLIKRDIIKKIEKQSDTNLSRTKICYVVNPYIFLRGTDIEKEIVELFVNTKWAKE